MARTNHEDAVNEMLQRPGYYGAYVALQDGDGVCDLEDFSAEELLALCECGKPARLYDIPAINRHAEDKIRMLCSECAEKMEDELDAEANMKSRTVDGFVRI